MDLADKPSFLKDEVLATLAYMSEGGDPSSLFSFLSDDKKQSIDSLIHSCGPQENLDPAALMQRLKRQRRNKLSGLDDIHPDWIVEKFEDETPRIWGAILKCFSSEKSKEIQSLLPKDLKKNLPRLEDTCRISSKLIRQIRETLEMQLSTHLLPQSERGFTFYHLALLKSEDLQIFFRDLGLEEIRCAFHGVDPQIYRTFVRRFSLETAQKLKDKIDQAGVISPEDRKEAQKNIVSLSLQRGSTEDLFLEIGYSVFVRALFPQDKDWARSIIYRLPLREGARMRRYLQELVVRGSRQRIEERQTAILGLMRHLADEGVIRKYWK